MKITVQRKQSDKLGLQLHSFLKWLKDYGKCSENEGQIEIDLGQLRFIHPIISLPIAAIKNSDKRVTVSTSPDISSYLDTIRFPEGFTANSQLETGFSAKTFIPITRFPLSHDNQSKEARNKTISEFNEFVIRQIPDKEVGRAIRHTIDELCDNIVDHSKAEFGYLTGQYYPTKGLLDLCIVDTGIGIQASYANGGIDVISDADAMQKVLERLSSKDRPKNERGFGLLTSRKVVNALGGSIYLISGKAILHDELSILDIGEIGCNWSGTICAMQIEVKKPSGFNFYNLIG